MASAAKRRDRRRARKQTASQRKCRRWNKRCALETQIITKGFPLPGNIRDVTPFTPTALLNHQ